MPSLTNTREQDMAAEITLGNEMSDFVTRLLLKHQPYMKLERIHGCAEQCRLTVEERVTMLSAEIEDTKSRIDFLSLSAELRNRIYELALTPEEEDEGGVEGSTAIYVGEGMDREGWEQVKLFEGYHYESHYNFGWPTPWVGQPALTKVSRQIRQETLPVYYGLNYFAAAVDGDVEVDGNPMLEIINEDDVNPINHEWLNHSYYLPVNCLLSWMVCIGQENIDRLRQLQIFTDSEPAGVFLDGKSRGPQNIPGEKAEIRVRRWLERELARHDLTMPHVSLTTHTWCPELEGGKWLQTN